MAQALFKTPARRFSQQERIRWLEGISDIYSRMRTRGDGGPYEVECHVPLAVFPNVYAPDLFTDSWWFADTLPRIIGKKSLLEIGTGCGVIAVVCALRGAFIVATDVNPYAVANARENVKRHASENSVSIRQGDMYSPLCPGEKFDYIFWSHPFNNWPTPVRDLLFRSGMDHGYQNLRTYISRAEEHLAPSGRLLLGTGDSADLEEIQAIAADSGLDVELIDSTRMALEYGGKAEIRYLILEFRKRKGH